VGHGNLRGAAIRRTAAESTGSAKRGGRPSAAPRAPSRFSHLARTAANLAGHPLAFTLAAAAIVVWAIAGPLCGYSEGWQLVINTSTTIATFLMMFLIQNTQNRESVAVQLKLDELIRAVQGAHNVLIDLEDLDQEKLERIRRHYLELARRARDMKSLDTGSPEVDTSPDSDDAREK